MKKTKSLIGQGKKSAHLKINNASVVVLRVKRIFSKKRMNIASNPTAVCNFFPSLRIWQGPNQQTFRSFYQPPIQAAAETGWFDGHVNECNCFNKIFKVQRYYALIIEFSRDSYKQLFNGNYSTYFVHVSGVLCHPPALKSWMRVIYPWWTGRAYDNKLSQQWSEPLSTNAYLTS